MSATKAPVNNLPPDLIDREAIYLGRAFQPAEDPVRYAEQSLFEPTPGLLLKVGGG